MTGNFFYYNHAIFSRLEIAIYTNTILLDNDRDLLWQAGGTHGSFPSTNAREKMQQSAE